MRQAVLAVAIAASVLAGCSTYSRVPGAEEHYLVLNVVEDRSPFGRDVNHNRLMHCSKIVKHWYKPNEFPPEHCVWAGEKDANGHATPDPKKFAYSEGQGGGYMVLTGAIIAGGLAGQGALTRPATIAVSGVSSATSNSAANAAAYSHAQAVAKMNPTLNIRGAHWGY